MKLRISDLMDHADPFPVELKQKDVVSADRIKAAALQKVRGASTRAPFAGRLSRAGLIAAVLAAALCVTAAAAAVKWSGFAFTGGMSDAEKAALLQSASTMVASELVEPDGTVHYLDENGRETLVLSAEDAAAYEQAKNTAQEQAVLESTARIDAATLSLLPRSITELPVDADGAFAECALGNGCMILLHPEGQDGFSLSPGDSVTIALTANDSCILEFSLFRDGAFVTADTAAAGQHSFTFPIDEPGLYCFGVEYCSAGASTFTDCTLTIQ